MTRRRRTALFRWLKGSIAGVLIGIACWQVLGVVDGGRSPTVVTGMARWMFVSLAIRGDSPPTAGDDTTRLTEVRVHPPADGKQLVTGRVQTPDKPEGPFEFVASVPFVVPPARDGSTAERSYPTVRAFLDQDAPKLPYRYMWWELPEARAAIAIGAPMLLFGVLMPLTIGLLIHFGVLPAPPEPEPEPEPAPAKHEPIASSIAPMTAAEAEPALAGLPPGEATTYEGGVYYPVHIPKPSEK